jgi:hypothetical protein
MLTYLRAMYVLVRHVRLWHVMVMHIVIMHARVMHIMVWNEREMHVCAKYLGKASYGKALVDNSFKAKACKDNISKGNA